MEPDAGTGGPADAQVALVRSMWEAWQDGRMDDFVATMHPDAIWRPSHRPTRSAWQGHDGMRTMRTEVERERGATDVFIEQTFADPDGSVHSLGFVEFANSGGKVPFEVQFTFRDGLIFIADTVEGPG